MVYKCFVYGCKSHKLPKHTTFGVPKDPELLWQWQVALRPYCNGKELQSKHRVCKSHFRQEELEFFYTHLIQGTEVKIERGRPELKKGAIPSIFPGQKKPPRRILQYKNGEKKEKTQSILMLNGEWVHKKPQDIPERPARKRTDKRSANKSLSTTGELENSSPQVNNSGQKQKKPTENISEISDDIKTLNLSEAILELPAVKPQDVSSISINWNALPLPEEIGSLLCDSLVPPVNSSSDFQKQSPKSQSKPPPVTVDLPSKDLIREEISREEFLEEHLSTADYGMQQLQQKEENSVLSFEELLVNMPQILVPSSMWGIHTDHSGVFFTLMTYSGSTAVPKVQKIVMYQGSMIPRIFVRGIEVSIFESEEKSASIEEIEQLLSLVDNLKLCVGVDSTGEDVSYSSECQIFAASGRLPRCPSCFKGRLKEYSRKRHLETDRPTTSPSRSPKKKSAAK